MSILNKDTLFSRVIVKPVELSDGNIVHIAPLPAAEVVGVGEVQMEKLILRSLCDADGTLFFQDDDAGRTLRLPLPDFSILSKAIMELNGTKTAEGETGQAEKN